MEVVGPDCSGSNGIVRSPAWALRKTELWLTGLGDSGSRTGLAERRVKRVEMPMSRLLDVQTEILNPQGRIYKKDTD